MNYRFKKIIAFVLALVMLLSMSVASFADTVFIFDDLGRLVEIHRPNGDRTIFTYDEAGNIINISVITVDAVEIRTADELSNIRHNLAGSFRLVNDIDMTGVDWIPLGTRAMPFTGMIDGNGFTIKNLNIYRPGQEDVGLFGRNSGTIINIAVYDARVVGANNTGIIAGHNTGNIIDSRAYGASVVNGRDNVGGIAGHNLGGILRTFTTSSVFGNNNVGGFAGLVAGGNIEQGYATGEVSGENNVGGFVGHLTDSSSAIRNAFASGQVFSSGNGAGFVGLLASGRIENSYSISNNANGFSGNTSGMIINSYFDRDIILSSNFVTLINRAAIESLLAVMEARSTQQMMSRDNFVGWDFYTIWDIDEGVNYPILRALSEPPIGNINIDEDIAWLTFD
ncbi:MAG: RHS repeat protein, partial [Defluviitaleaceae bacterium]|nr:RHS repeat protein [Defluviitaleaceae bacterium]